jgi:protein gp37
MTMLDTTIQWADSTRNLQMGCDGCELWNPKTGVRRCYAGHLTGRFGGRKGWPVKVELPTIFPERLADLFKWPDLTGKDRPHKAWLNGLPRTVFLNDMGDSFTEGLPIDWMAEFIPDLVRTKHIYIVLTKRAHRMAEFFRGHGTPRNFWLCTSITNHASLSRIPHLLTIPDAPVLGLSIEPLWEDVSEALARVPGIERITWAKIGGESGTQAKDCDVQWFRNIATVLRRANPDCSIFVKQTGTKAFDNGVRLKLLDWEGGDWSEWPRDIQVREMPWNALCVA